MENNSNNNPSNQNRSWEDNNYSNQGFDSTKSGQQYQQQSGQNWSSQPYRSKLPADPSSLVLAIIATVITIVCCCAFVGPFIGLTLSIIGFIIAQSSMKKYEAAPNNYDPNSYRKVSNAKIFNLVVGIISLLLSILLISGLVDDFTNQYDYLDMMEEDEEFYNEDMDYQETEVEDDWYEYEEEVDSVKEEIDTLEIEIEEVIESEEVPQD